MLNGQPPRKENSMKLNELVAVIGVERDSQWVELIDNLKGDVLANFAIGDLQDSVYDKFQDCDVKDITSTKNSSCQTRLVVKIEYNKQVVFTKEEYEALRNIIKKLG